uniref:Uncharacterized protein n=1 Tax=Myoviridae sp. ctjhW4 TaxID=2825162 RepID=A0A8S5PRB2_9CAUD|nr:MAG TPA: hypothetical protein [Myoviridae sp. ctjhW4]
MLKYILCKVYKVKFWLKKVKNLNCRWNKTLKIIIL